MSGYFEKGLFVLGKVLQSIDMSMPTTSQSYISIFLHRLQYKIHEIINPIGKTTGLTDHQLFKIDTCWSAALSLSMVDTIRGLDFQCRHLVLALQSGEPYRIGRALALEAAFSALSGNKSLGKTRLLLERSSQLAQTSNNPHAKALLMLVVGVVASLEGRWSEAQSALEKAEKTLSQITGVVWELTTARYFWFFSMTWMGEYAAISQRMESLFNFLQRSENLYAYTVLQQCSFITHLAADQPDKALQATANAMKKWQYQGFHIQKLWDTIVKTHTALYLNDGLKAWEEITAFWSNTSKVFLFQTQYLKINFLRINAFCALSAAQASSNRKTFLKTAYKNANMIEKENTTWGDGFVKLIKASIAYQNKEQGKSILLLEKAEESFSKANMKTYMVALQHYRGLIIGGEKGQRLITSASEYLKQQGVKNIDCMCRMLAPGFG